jgi:AcrR family transcriptional regulator
MQDIINECGISRGGIYIYYASVDEVFLDVVKQRNAEGITTVSKAVDAAEPFWAVYGAYMAKQKARLTNFENSLFRAYCEYIFSRPKDGTQIFRDGQLAHLRGSVLSILTLGVNQGAIRNEKIARLADHFIVTIDGLSVLALGALLTDAIVEEQFAVLAEMVGALGVL